MRITEIFALGYYGYSDDCYCGRGHDGHYGDDKHYRYGGYGRRRYRSYDDRDTPLARLKGSRL